MAKKSFKDNPALQFISLPVEEDEPKAAYKAENLTPPKGFKLNPLYIEKKSKRLQLLIQPSIYEKMKALADKRGISINQFIHSLLEAATKEEK